MRRKRLLWQLYPSYLLITIASLAAAGWFASSSLTESYDALAERHLETDALLVQEQIRTDVIAGNWDGACATIRRFSEVTSTRVTLITPTGAVRCDSDHSANLMENHADRPEFKQALERGIGGATRDSNTALLRLRYKAVALTDRGQVLAVIRTSIPMQQIDQVLRSVRREIATAGVMIAALAALVGLFVSRRIAAPLEEMTRGAERFAQGELNYKLLIPDSAELASLALALNQMARQLEERITEISRQGHQQEAVLESMVEGVLAVDNKGRVISLNRAAAELLQCDVTVAPGRTLQEVIRNGEMRRFVHDALSGASPVEGDIVLHTGSGRTLQARGTALRDPAGSEGLGAVIVLNDVTQLRRLENLRRDFVANVSHELKTPITSIKGFVETLLDGAIENRDDAERFLRIVAKQADRLNAIIEDLLSLAKIEQGSDEIHLTDEPLQEILDAALLNCNAKAAEREIQVSSQSTPGLRLRANAPLLEQAVTNLLDNAIKYSEPGSTVYVRGERTDGEVVIEVRDTGVGIGADHLPRLFERFYRVDKARSRKLGGTGLGLAIVKHIVNAHGGRVTVQSTPGAGSSFQIRLPG